MSVSQSGSVLSTVSGGTKVLPPSCTRCRLSINSGHAYELGGDRWHTQCFKCYKCNKELTCDSDFLVLGTGTLICFECADSCKGCGKKIDDLAIILSSSKEAYCSDCFKCCKCGKKIDDLKYAKTKRGLFCISCHERLLAKRKNAEEKKRRLQKELPTVPAKIPQIASSAVSDFETTRAPAKTSSGAHLSPQSLADLEDSRDPTKTSGTPLSPKSIKSATEPFEDIGQSSYMSDNSSPIPTEESRFTSSVIFDEAERVRPADSLRRDSNVTYERHAGISSKPNQHKRVSSIKSNSWSVVAQFLEDDEDDPVNGDADVPTLIQQINDNNTNETNNKTLEVDALEFNSREPQYLTSESSRRLLAENNKIVNGAGGYTQEFNTDTLEGLQRHYSVDEVLKRTLSKEENPDPHYVNNVSEGELASNFLLNKTPLRNKEDPLQSKSPLHRRGVIMSDSGEFIGDLLVPPDDGLHLSSGKHSVPPIFLDGADLSPSQLDYQERRRSKPSSLSVFAKYDGPTSTASSQASSIQNSTSSQSLDPKYSKSPSNQGSTSGKSSVTRSGSVRNKVANLIHSKKSSTPNKNQQIDSNIDTHTGWGVTFRNQQQDFNFLGGSSNGRKLSNPHGRGQSDSTIYSQISPKSSSKQSFGHSRSRSGFASASRVAVNMTPPLSTHHLPMINKASSKDEYNDDKTPTNDEFFKRDLINEELTLRQLRMVTGELQNTKNQLLSQIDQLRKTKEELQYQVDMLRMERREYQSNLSEEMDETQVAIKQVVTSTTSSTKPRFWKLFSGKPTHSGHSNNNSAASGSGQNGSSNSSPFGNISHPILQNPNEFEDWKLISVNPGADLYRSTLVLRVAYEGNELPMILSTCIAHIEASMDHITSEGIYRKSGSQVLIEQIENEFIQWKSDSQISERLYEFLNQDIHAVTSVLKRYLRKLPDPILTFQVYEPLMQLVREEKLCSTLSLKSAKNSQVYPSIVTKLASLLRLLPTEHLSVLKALCQHINLIAKYQDLNLMNLNNLSLVFTPSLIRDYSGEKDITDMKERNYLIGFIFTHYDDIYASL
ncbi:HEL023Wp [Eremothecium sinecaudum]|uniref:HEL023Wp n=1 Tax=Eremothecium sinecaudum TaxID=45286 RepID=A0A109UZF4_9SACH|nr:HEL023Wp [Eremothecium sinecaudum]AMD21257.1 HEL023Wp [Eremothecium sinecaudum]